MAKTKADEKKWKPPGYKKWDRVNEFFGRVTIIDAVDEDDESETVILVQSGKRVKVGKKAKK